MVSFMSPAPVCVIWANRNSNSAKSEYIITWVCDTFCTRLNANWLRVPAYVSHAGTVRNDAMNMLPGRWEKSARNLSAASAISCAA